METQTPIVLAGQLSEHLAPKGVISCMRMGVGSRSILYARFDMTLAAKIHVRVDRVANGFIIHRGKSARQLKAIDPSFPC